MTVQNSSLRLFSSYQSVTKLNVILPVFSESDERRIYTVGIFASSLDANKIADVFRRTVGPQVRGGIRTSLDFYYAEVVCDLIDGKNQWSYPKDAVLCWEEKLTQEHINGFTAAFLKYVKGLKVPVTEEGDEFQGVYINPKRKAPDAPLPPPKRSKTELGDPEDELRESFGFAPFQTKKQLHRELRKWFMKNHPDKQPLEDQEKATKNCQSMTRCFESVLKKKGWEPEPKQGE